MPVDQPPKLYDVVIIGAGPAGVICAYQLRHTNFRIAIIDKDQFPRDKICGDVLSADVMNQLYKLDEDLGNAFQQLQLKHPSRGIRFIAPSQEVLDIEYGKSKIGIAPGFVSKRVDFDNFLINQIRNLDNVDIYEGCKIESIERSDTSILVISKQQKFQCKILVGADGANSVVKRKLAKTKSDKKHLCAGLRRYYKNVSGLHPEGYIELHFYKETQPGYFWIFPLPNGEANVGIGMRSDAISKYNINLKTLMNDIITTHPNIKDRFSSAVPLESIQGFSLPIGSKRRSISGEGYLLLGDAANLIDPFTGEGIGNAIRSGRVAANHISKALTEGQFGADFNKAFDREIYKLVLKELRISRFLQGLLKYPRLFSFVIRKANKNTSIRQVMTSMLDNVDIRQELMKPSFYINLLLK